MDNIIRNIDTETCNSYVCAALGKVKGHFGPMNTLAWRRDGKGFVTGGEEPCRGLIMRFTVIGTPFAVRLPY